MAKPRTVGASDPYGNPSDEQQGPLGGAGGPVQPDAQPRSPTVDIGGGLGGASGASGQLPGDAQGARGQEGPRDRAMSMASPDQPNYPSPMGGAQVRPFNPMPNIDPGSLVTPKAGGGLYGSMGGLKGGGLGVPLDPTSNAQSDPLSALIQALMGKM